MPIDMPPKPPEGTAEYFKWHVEFYKKLGAKPDDDFSCLLSEAEAIVKENADLKTAMSKILEEVRDAVSGSHPRAISGLSQIEQIAEGEPVNDVRDQG